MGIISEIGKSGWKKAKTAVSKAGASMGLNTKAYQIAEKRNGSKQIEKPV